MISSAGHEDSVLSCSVNSPLTLIPSVNYCCLHNPSLLPACQIQLLFELFMYFCLAETNHCYVVCFVGCEDTVPTVSTMVPSCKLPEESDASMRARLFTSLSQSFPHSQLYKALHGGEDINLNAGDNSEDDDDSLYGDHLSNSCFASLRMDRRDSDDFDDDLRSLEWLQNEDLLKNIGGEKLDKEDDDSGEQKENEDIKPDIRLLQGASGQQPANLSYLPQKHINSKPPYSFSCLIFMAVEASPEKRLPVKDIYNWILTQFPYFQNAPTGWKNSVRHNLSLNKCFKKVEKDKGQVGKSRSCTLFSC